MNKRFNTTGGAAIKAVCSALVLIAGIVSAAMLGSTSVLSNALFWPVAVIWVLLSALAGFGVFKFNKWHKVRNVVSIVGAVIIMLVSAFTIAYSVQVNSLFTKIHEPDSGIETTLGVTDKPFVLYVSGIDTRTDELPASARSDVNIIVVIDPVNHRILTVNTPRDFYVELATFGANDKLTHAGIYGVGESLKTLEKLYDISIDYYAKVNFNTIVEVVDTIGGIEVESEYAFSNSGHKFVMGTNKLDGKSALAFSRERYSFSGGDRVRGQNQQRVIEAIFNKILQPNIIANASSILDILADSLRTNMTTNDVKALIREQISNGANWTFENIAVDGTGGSDTTYSGGSQLLYVMYPNIDTVNTAKAKINEYLTTQESELED